MIGPPAHRPRNANINTYRLTDAATDRDADTTYTSANAIAHTYTDAGNDAHDFS